ncbi:MAG: glycosyl transferase family protein, partial [Sphingomonadaceae bacterium]
QEALLLCGLVILLNAVDDFAVDLLTVPAWIAARMQPLPAPPAQPGRFAVLVPAWDEARVIAAMLRNTLARLDHPDFLVFVGVYPNDAATKAAVSSVRDPRIRCVVTSRPGPTTKADCLNHLWRAAKAEECESGRRFRAIVLHDAEDVVHADELALFDQALERFDMVQIPVVPIADFASGFIAGHYLDEFATAHARDMMVRTWLRAPLPSAGVGTAIARDALARLEGADAKPFDEQSLTEDYELGYRLHRLGMRGGMVRHRGKRGLVCVRAYFPDRLEAAVRQKSRWLTGIGLSGWDRLGWAGGPAARWMLFRDRKGIVTAVVALAGYAVFAAILLQALARWWLAGAQGVAAVPVLPPASPFLVALMLAAGLVLAWRLLVRAALTARVGGMIQAVLSIPRAPVGNFVNALAAIRALGRYRQEVESGRIPPWDKTQHRFPDEVTLHG